MEFTHTLDLVLSGRKTHTRRPYKAGDTFDGTWIYNADGHKRYGVGQSRSLQAGRGQQGVGDRILITSIALDEDVRDITQAEAELEGFDSPEDFLTTWASLRGISLSTLLADPPSAIRIRAWDIHFVLNGPAKPIYQHQHTLFEGDNPSGF